MPTLGSSCAVLGEFLLGGSCDVPPTPAPFVLLTGFTDNGELTHNAIGEMLSMSVTRGIDPDQGAITVGTAQVTLKNHDGRYSELRTDSPLYPNVEVGRGVESQLRDSAGDLQGQFKGTVREISLDPAPTTRQASLDCVDYLETLRRVVISTPLYENKRSDELIAALLTLAGYTGATDLEQGAKSFPFASWRNVGALDAIQQVIDTEQGTFFISKDGLPTFHNRYHRITTTTPEATFNNSFDGFTYRVSVDDVYNEAIVTAHPRVKDTSAFSALWRWDEAPYFLGAGKSLVIDADYNNPDGGGGICEGADVVTPVATTDYKAYTNANGTGTNKTAYLSISAFTAYGQHATLTITNTDSVGFYVTLLQVRGHPITQPTTVTAREVDQDSIDQYGFKSTITLDLPLESTLEGARDVARYLMQVYGNPIKRITLQVKPADDTRLDALANLDLNGVVEVTQPDVGLDGMLFFIDQIQSEIGDTVAGMVTTYSCTAVPAFDYIILDNPDQTFDDILGA